MSSICTYRQVWPLSARSLASAFVVGRKPSDFEKSTRGPFVKRKSRNFQALFLTLEFLNIMIESVTA